MDRDVTVKFFRITGGKRVKKPFLIRLTALQALNGHSAVRMIEDVPFWCDKIAIEGHVVSGRFCRRQTSHLPPRAPLEGGLEPLGVKSVGQTAAWRYNAKQSVLAMETSRNGLTLARLLSYVRAVCACSGYGFLPVTTDVNLELLRQGRIREFSFQVATPKNLECATPEQVAMRHGMEGLMSPNLSTLVQVKYSLESRDQDIKSGPVSRIASWLRREKSADRGNITKLKARILDADGDSRPLELLDEAHLISQSEIDLPDDDPDRSYEVRKVFLITHKPQPVSGAGRA